MRVVINKVVQFLWPFRGKGYKRMPDIATTKVTWHADVAFITVN
jgi:hypothetical protein